MYKTTRGKSNMQTCAQDINDELFQLVTAAIHHGLVPDYIIELEFTVNNDGQASHIEYWPNTLRNAEERVEITIPNPLLDKFVFKTLNKL